MAEFLEVMKQKERMCDAIECCNDCPINDELLPCDSFITNNPQKAEELIMSWSKEHPIKTNADIMREFLITTFGEIEEFNIANYVSFPCVFKCDDDCICGTCEHSGFWNKEYKEVTNE